MELGYRNLWFLIVVCLAACLSSGYAYYRYVFLENFAYFQTEEEVPSQFDFLQK